jgi:uncharacterized membrane protein YfcA
MRAKATAHLAAAAFFSGAAMLYKFPPELYHFYPQCPVFRYLHVLCPGCGATRALAALLHGEIAQALHYNAFVVFLLPVVLYCLLRTYISVLRGEAFSWPQMSPVAIRVVLLTGFFFAFFRNFDAFWL